MSWPNFQYLQDDLGRLCRVPEVAPVEWYHVNQFFGFNSVIKAYAGLPDHEPLPWTMALQVSYDRADIRYRRHLASNAPFLLVPTEAQAAYLRPRTTKGVQAVGSAFYYLQPLFQRRHPQGPVAAERRGTLVFPDKTTWESDTTFDRQGFARSLAALPAEFQPVAVSIFWEDYRRGHHRPYARAGLQLVTSGHPCDPEFLFRQYDLCRQFRYACANDISTSYCMAVLAGCRFFYWPTGPIRMKCGKGARTFDREPTLTVPGKQACLAAAPFPPVGDGAEQRVLAERYAGKESVRPPEFFRELAATGRSQVLALPPVSVQVNSETTVDRAVACQPWGFHSDGWSAASSRLVIPSVAGYAGVRLNLDVRVRWSRFWKPVGTITLDDRPDDPLTLWPGRWCLEVPCRADGRPRQLDFNCRDGHAPHHGAHCRAFRLAAITWLEQVSSSLPTMARAARVSAPAA